MSAAEPQPAVPKPVCGWHLLTPGRVVMALVALECLLWLSEHLQWFAFNRQKGLAVLIGVVALVAVLLFMLLWFAASLLFRRRFQFSIRSLLVLTVALAIQCSWLKVEVTRARQQREAEQAIDELHGSLGHECEYDFFADISPERPIWPGGLLRRDFFWSLDSVDFWCRPITDSDLKCLKWPPDLHDLCIGGTQVTDVGLEHLKGLGQLQRLSLLNTQITDAGLHHIEVLPHLQLLNLTGTEVTAEGVKKLQQALPHCEIDWTPPTPPAR